MRFLSVLFYIVQALAELEELKERLEDDELLKDVHAVFIGE